MFLCHSFPLFSVGERSQLQYNHVLVVVVVVVVVAVVVIVVGVVIVVLVQGLPNALWSVNLAKRNNT